MANLSFLPIQDDTEDIGGGVGQATGDPGADLVAELLAKRPDIEELLANLDLPQAPTRPKVGVGRRIAGTLGDALTAFASVQAGGRPPLIGSFAAGQQALDREFRQQAIAAEEETRQLKNRIRVRDFERKAEERAAARLPAGTSAKDNRIVVTQAMVDAGEFQEDQLGDVAIVRDTIDDDTSETLKREIVGIARDEQDKLRFPEFQGKVDKEMVKRFPHLKEREGEFLRFRDTVNEEGITTNREALAPGQEGLKFINTPDGLVPVGTKSGNVKGALVGPDGEFVVSFKQKLLELQLKNQRDVFLRGAKLPAETKNKLIEQGEARDGAEAALRRYVELGKPELGSLQTGILDRLKTDEAILARAAVASALVPIKKHFLGGAVTPQEAQSAEPLIAMIERGVAPRILEASLFELINLARRSRKRILMDSRAADDDISGFEHELSDGSLDPIKSLEQFLEGENIPELRHRVVVDENGNFKIEE